jgi:hypothetical protein
MHGEYIYMYIFTCGFCEWWTVIESVVFWPLYSVVNRYVLHYIMFM